MRQAPSSHPPTQAWSLDEALGLGWHAVLICSADDRVLAMNAAAERLTGFRREELVGLKAGFDGARLLPEGLAESWEAQRRSLPAGAPEPELTITLEDRSGNLRTCRVRILPFGAPGDPRSCTTIMLREVSAAPDVHPAPLAEHYRALVGHTSDVVFHLRPNLEVLFVNPAALPVLGHDPASLLGTRLALPEFLPPAEVRRLRMLGRRVLREGFEARLFRVIKRSGELIWCLITLVTVSEADSQPTFLVLLRDVSEFYETKEQLETKHAQLASTVAKLEEANLLQEQFVANVTHELRTPLTTILVTAELLERAAKEGWPAPHRRQVELIHKNARVLMETINDLLDLAKLRRERFKVARQAIHLREFLAGLMEEVEPLFSQKHLSLQLEVGPDVPEHFSTDPSILRRIVTNLLSNAYKFTERGGAFLSAHMKGGCLCISLADTGIGIERENIPNIFEEFRQIDASDARRYPGTGLGLPIAERFTTLLGGRIEVDSSPSKGSTFAILLPETPGESPAGS
jgi:PAS domain S-box-containing protein